VWPFVAPPAQKKWCLLVADALSYLLPRYSNGSVRQPVLDQLEEVIGDGQDVAALAKIQHQLLAHLRRDTGANDF
jgi:hypothetical protein